MQFIKIGTRLHVFCIVIIEIFQLMSNHIFTQIIHMQLQISWLLQFKIKKNFFFMHRIIYKNIFKTCITTIISLKHELFKKLHNKNANEKNLRAGTQMNWSVTHTWTNRRQAVTREKKK